MSNKLSAKDINTLVSYIRENISVYAGTGDDKRCLVKPGLKISHKKTGIQYTVQSVRQCETGISIICSREPDTIITITGNDLKQFERA